MNETPTREQGEASVYDRIDERVRRLAEARVRQKDAQNAVENLELMIAATELGERLAEARALLDCAREGVTIADADLRGEALFWHDATGNKHPHAAVEIKLVTALAYDEAAAIDYSRQHLPKALKLDKRAFEKAAKVLGLDFVQETQEPKPYIASDLSAYFTGYTDEGQDIAPPDTEEA